MRRPSSCSRTRGSHCSCYLSPICPAGCSHIHIASLSPRTAIERTAVYPAIGAAFGCWSGAIPIGLDWERPWQVRNLTSHLFAKILSHCAHADMAPHSRVWWYFGLHCRLARGCRGQWHHIPCADRYPVPRTPACREEACEDEEAVNTAGGLYIRTLHASALYPALIVHLIVVYSQSAPLPFCVTRARRVGLQLNW